MLAPNQSLLGRCAVHLKRHAADLASLHQTELLDWLTVVKSFESALQATFGATIGAKITPQAEIPSLRSE